jgi:thiamine biosynthesis lipoprotein
MGRLTAKTLSMLLCAVFSAAAVSCMKDPGYAVVSGTAQGGLYSVKFSLDGVSRTVPEIRGAVDSILHLVDTTLSGYNRKSQLSRFNAGEQVVPNDLFRDIFALSRNLYYETGGAFDVAAGPLFDAWGFGFTQDSLPDGHTVDSLLACCGMDAVGEDMSSLVPGQRPVLNFNAVAQGYTCDMVRDYLHSIGVRNMLVDIGEIYCEGLNPAGKGWTIGVDNPVDGNDTPGQDLRGVWQSDGGACGIVTSGNYRKFYVKDGKKYAHTIDPRTGYPVEHGLLSATVVAPTAAEADALATACMVLGPEAAKELIQSRPELEGYLIMDSGTWTSDGFSLLVP